MNALSTNPRISIAIIGGGVAGLALAAGLIKHRHLDVHVYEAVEAYADVGAGLALHQNALRAMECLGPEVREAYVGRAVAMASDEDEVVATEVFVGHGPHAGQRVAELGPARGRKSISRADLLAGLLALVPRERISFGKRLLAIQEAPTARRKTTV